MVIILLLFLYAQFPERTRPYLWSWCMMRGMAMMRKKYMKQMGHADAQMFFYVDSAEELAQKIGAGTRVLMEEPYYRYIPRNGLKLSTKVSMAVSDRLRMVKTVCFQL